MWRPDTVGDIIAERVCELVRGTKRAGRIKLSFGRPIRAPSPEPRDPWWCPVRIRGSGIDLLRPIAGVDSLQALLLALQCATDVLPAEAKRIGARVEWLGDAERVIFARQGLAAAADGAITALLGRLKMVAGVLDSSARGSRAAKDRALDALNIIGRSVGHGPKTASARRRPGRRDERDRAG